MSALSVIRQLWQHGLWADEELLRALGAASGDQDEAWREYLHVLGAEEVWLSRLDQRAARTPVWPSGSPDDAAALRITIAGGYARRAARAISPREGQPTPTSATNEPRADGLYRVRSGGGVGHEHRSTYDACVRRGCSPVGKAWSLGVANISFARSSARTNASTSLSSL